MKKDNSPLCLVSVAALAALFVVPSGGCLAVKTEHEVKPIHITMDVNLKVDREIEKTMEAENRTPPPGAEIIRSMADSGLIGMDNRGYFVARGEISEEQRDAIDDYNSARRAKMVEIAASTGVSRADVEKRRVVKIRQRLPEGKGLWYQLDDGSWTQKK